MKLIYNIYTLQSWLTNPVLLFFFSLCLKAKLRWLELSSMWAPCILSNLINKILFPVCPVWAAEHFSPLVFRQLPKCNRYQGNRLEGRPGRIAFSCKSHQFLPTPEPPSSTHTHIHNKQSTQSHFCCQFVLIL